MNIVFSGPSGAGKGTLTEMFLKVNNFKKFTTCTTRKPREGEKDGFDYYFHDKETFIQKVNAGEMFNVKEYGGNCYGSLEEDMDNIQTMKNVIFQITPDRAIQMKQKNLDTCMILIIPPTAETLINRRKDRSKERIQNDIQNLEVAKNFDYIIVNDNIEQAYENIKLCIEHFQKGGNCNFLVKDNIYLIENLINGLNVSIEEKGVEKVFNNEVAKKWDKKEIDNTNYHDIKIDDYGISWNLGSKQTFAIDNSINEAGCVHSVQGLEFDYVGVIIGKDLYYEDGKIHTNFQNHASSDPSFKGIKKIYKEDKERANQISDVIIKNTYRVLLTRGIKGCYVYCVDPSLNQYLKEQIRLYKK